MLYVRESLVPGERIVFGGYFHWMYLASAITWIFIGLGIAFAILYAGIMIQYNDLPAQHFGRAIWELHPIVRIAAFLAFLFGVLRFGLLMAIRATTEIAVTTKRLIFKRGVVARHVDEISIDRIEGVIVEQGILGRILSYGRVVVRGMGVGAIVLPDMIESPINFRKAIERAREEKRATSPSDI